MANITNIATECQTITDAFASIKTFIYDRLEEINAGRAKQYPVLLLDSNATQTNLKYDKSTGLPSVKQYATKLFFFDLYDETSKDSTDLETKQGDLQQIADQWWAEFRRRNDNNSNGLLLANKDTIAGLFAHDTQNDKLIQIAYDVVFRTFEESCTVGTFNY